MNLTSVSYDRNYVMGQVLKFNAAINRTHQLDCLWRIASNADLYSPSDLQSFSQKGMPSLVQGAIVQWLQSEGFKVN